MVLYCISKSLPIITYSQDITKINNIKTKKTGKIIDYKIDYIDHNKYLTGAYKSLSDIALIIYLDDGKEYTFNRSLKDLSSPIDVGDEISFYYSKDIYPNTNYDSFGLEKDGVTISPKVVKELQETYDLLVWQCGFIILLCLGYLYKLVKDLLQIKKLGFKGFVNKKYLNIK